MSLLQSVYYIEFQLPDDECKDWSPAFYDSNGSPIYENSRQDLLHRVISENDLEALSSYIHNPVMNVFKENYEKQDQNPFFFASRYGSLDALRSLVQKYLSDLREPLVEYLARHEIYLLHNACTAGNGKMISWLLNHHDPPLRTIHPEALRLAVQSHQTICIYSLSPRPWEIQVAHASAARQHVHGARRARQRMCKMREKRDRIEEYIIWLLDSGCSISECDELDRGIGSLYCTALSEMVIFASYEMISRLIIEGADVHARLCAFNESGESPLHIAAAALNSEAILAMIDHRGGIELLDMVSMPDNNGQLPLHWALSGDRLFNQWPGFKDRYSDGLLSRAFKTIKILLDTNPSTINARDQHGANVFQYVVKSGMGQTTILQIINFLLDYGADPRSCDGHRRSILHILCSCPWVLPLTPDILDRLLEFVDINQTDSNGCTALHLLAGNLDQIDAVSHLIYRGADVDMIDLEGNSPLHKLMAGSIFSKNPLHNQIKDLVVGSIRDLEGKFLEQFKCRDDLPEIVGELMAETSDPVKRLRDDIIQVFLDAGASMDRTNKDGKTPQHVLEDVLERRERDSKEQERCRASVRGRRGRGRRG